ncbi:hypothetical protein T492DRAFT_873087 [Pavlovales sp. CCMP2436]|nr:hypothetical protein T492DRAFT_873087 [Pavlovales sp. CCMP2436]
MAATSGFAAELSAMGNCYALASQTTAVFIGLLTVCIAALLVATGFLLAVVSLRRAEANVAAGWAKRRWRRREGPAPDVVCFEAGDAAGHGRNADEIHRDLSLSQSPKRHPLDFDGRRLAGAGR